MSGAFDDIVLTWEGRTYTIPSQGVMRALAKVEEVATYGELVDFTVNRKTIPAVRISQCYGVLLRHAGCPVTDYAVYRGMFTNESVDAAVTAIHALLAIMTPPDLLLEDLAPAKGKGAEAPKANPTRKASSKRRTKSR